MRSPFFGGECVAFTVSYVPGCQTWVVFLFPSTDEVRVGGCGPQAEERCVCVSVYVCVRPCFSVYQSCRPEGSPPHTQPGPFSMSVQTRAPTSGCPGQGVRAGSQRADLGGLTRTICSWSHTAFPLEADCNSQAGNSVPGSFTLGWNQNLLCFGGRTGPRPGQ